MKRKRIDASMEETRYDSRTRCESAARAVEVPANGGGAQNASIVLHIPQVDVGAMQSVGSVSARHRSRDKWRVDLVLLVSGDDDTLDSEWPERTSELCLYCMHAFDTVPFGVPVRYNAHKHRYCLRGFYCSLECAYTSLHYDANATSRGRTNALNMFHSFARAVHGRSVVNERAPREVLAKLRAHYRLREGLSDAEATLQAVRQWRQLGRDGSATEVCGGASAAELASLRAVPHMFERVSQVYEVERQSEHVRLREERDARRVIQQKPRPLIMTAHGRREQERILRGENSALALPRRDAVQIDEWVQPVRAPESVPRVESSDKASAQSHDRARGHHDSTDRADAQAQHAQAQAQQIQQEHAQTQQIQRVQTQKESVSQARQRVQKAIPLEFIFGVV